MPIRHVNTLSANGAAGCYSQVKRRRKRRQTSKTNIGLSRCIRYLGLINKHCARRNRTWAIAAPS
jgi:hypothetical protein